MSLPKGWEGTTFCACQGKTKIVDPQFHSNETFDLFSVPSYSDYKPEAMSGSEIGSTKQEVRENDVLICKIVPHIRRGWTVPRQNGRRQIASGDWIVLRDHGFEAEFLRQFLLSDHFHEQFMNTVSGVGGSLMRARPAEAGKIGIPVPPLAEQRRIVTKLDALTARLGRARAELGRIDKLTVRLRDKIYGYFDSKDANGELQSLLEIPIRNGLSIKGSDTPPGVPALRLSALRTGLVDLTDVRYLPIDQNRAALYSLQDGDILVSRGNGTLSYVGRAALVVQPSTKNAAVIFPDTAFRIRVDKTKADPNWIVQIWNSPIVRSQIEGKARTTAGIWKISQRDLLEIRIPKLPLAEQQFASRRLAAGFARADRFEAEATRAKKLLDRLESAILAKAFRGELVPQDPTDEPSSILLDRIRAQRLAAPASKRGRSVKAASA